jgi:hypothetical protein
MRRGKKYHPEPVVNLLRQIEVAVANGKTTALAWKEAGIVDQRSALSYRRWCLVLARETLGTSRNEVGLSPH